MQHNFSLVTGNSHSVLNTEIEKLLHIFHVQVELTRFANSEIRVYVQDTDVKDKNVVFVLQTLLTLLNLVTWFKIICNIVKIKHLS